MTPPLRPSVFPLALQAFLGLAAFLFTACGTFSLDDNTPSVSGLRRVYVNDKAAADSLRPDLLRRGVKFVLQPNRSYEFSLDSTARTTDKLNLYYYRKEVPTFFKTISAASDGTREIFSLASDLPTAQFFMAKLVPLDGPSQALNGFRHVSLANASNLSTDTLQLRVVFVRKLRTLPDSASKVAFSKALFLEMGKIYSPFGIVFQGSISIVEPSAPPIAFKFYKDFVPLPGNRASNHAHLYLVDSIWSPQESGIAGEVLGFSPREVVDIDNHDESRVVLSARILQGQSAANGAISLGITAAHEIGHFFGLRHTVSTEHDFLQDKDFSNIEDGFTDTRFCTLYEPDGLFKKAVPDWNEILETQYCVRIAGDVSCTNFSCDRTNLMHPMDCGSRDQVRLTPQQITFLKTNLASYKH